MCGNWLNLSSIDVTGTDEERGIHIWRNLEMSKSMTDSSSSVYDLPFQKYIDKVKLFRYIPFCPAFLGSRKARHVESDMEKQNNGVDNPGIDINDVELNTQL